METLGSDKIVINLTINNFEKIFSISDLPQTKLFSCPSLDQIYGQGFLQIVKSIYGMYKATILTGAWTIPTHTLQLEKRLWDSDPFCSFSSDDLVNGTLKLRCSFSKKPIGLVDVPNETQSGTLNMDINKAYLDPNKDVAIVCGDEAIECHAFILTARSSVFRTMFGLIEKTEGKDGKVEIKVEEDPAVMKVFVKFLYTDILDDKEETGTLVALFKTADKYDVPNLKTKSQTLLCEKVSKSNAISLFLDARQYGAFRLKAVAAEKILAFFQDLKETEEMKALSEDPGAMLDILELQSILRSKQT